MEEYPVSGQVPDLSQAVNTLSVNHGGTGLTDSGTDSTKALMSNGSHGFVMSTPAGGGSSTPNPFAPVGFANISTMDDWFDLVISPDGKYVYVGGRS